MEKIFKVQKKIWLWQSGPLMFVGVGKVFVKGHARDIKQIFKQFKKKSVIYHVVTFLYLVIKLYFMLFIFRYPICSHVL